ncbi:cytochrome-c oxidase, cbb3-type subunit III [Hirschia baltica]|uniref:Cbb3-type cytochrome c oxidase subunit n=1 Tax=Hirschia baltica (strain ATCC 49814 / DSM 5838 / IFAM 1418) TaxID=582402 RepID=C6XJR7_HIRBI|nr:cytochrome-c oxidase, cbb3-type subunit III [Hirschia baltica]ACT59362.1 cytochrome c oxidase, cbb3-type, subunit III [Hirschia baltica ATCC 49814]
MTDNKNKDVDAFSGVETTGHEWDGIKELNNPLPRWWLYVWYATIAFSILWWILMPAWPALPGFQGNTVGVWNQSDRAQVGEAVGELRSARIENAQKLMSASLEEIEKTPELQQFALAMGESSFGDNCATCHGAGGRGAIGYPMLADDVWLWGGSLDDIQQTITYGIRSTHDETRYSEMPAFGRDGFISESEIDDLVQKVLSLSGQEANTDAVARAEENFEYQCASCHGVDGTGDRTFGAPNLTDQEWLYGGDASAIRETIYSARNSIMPHWNERLDEATIKALAVYVHTLGGGE